MDEEDLAIAQQLATNRGGDLAVVEGANVGQHRMAFLRRGRDGRHLANTGDRHLQRARDRGGTHRQHVHAGAQPLHLLLVLHPEALLLIDHDETEILHLDIGVEQSMGADDDVDRAVGEPGNDLLGLLVGLEPRQRLDHDGEGAHALHERGVVLLDQQRGGHQHRDLFAVLHGFEHRPDRDLGLAVAHVATDQPVHRHGAFHVALDLVDGRQLVGSLVEGEGILEFALPGGVGGEGMALGGLPGGVELDQFGRDLLDRLASSTLALRPVRAAKPVQGRLLATDVAGHLVQGVGGHIEPVGWIAALAGAVLDDEVLADCTLHFALGHLHEPADPVLFVYDEVAGLQFERIDLLFAPRRHRAHVFGGGALPEDVLSGQHHQSSSGIDEAVLQPGLADHHHSFGRLDL